jgi:hypothetical protein
MAGPPAVPGVFPAPGRTPVSAPKLLPGDLRGHARLFARQHNTAGGRPQVTLYGTADEPQLYADSPGDVFSGIGVHPKREDLIRFAREVLAFYGEDYGVTLPPWRPDHDGAGKRVWFLTRYSGEDDQSVPLEDRYRFDSRGVLIRYASMTAAQRAADKLNAAERDASADDSTRALDAIAGILSQDRPGNWQTAMEQRESVIRVLRRTGRMQEASS